MNTPWHAFWTYAVFHRRNWWTKAVIASVIPDIPFFISSAYFFARNGVNMESWILAYEHPWSKPVGSLTHSLVIAILGLAAAFFLQRKYWYPYFYGWIFHIFTDMLTHVSDAQPVLWPLSQRRLPGLISYWERDYYSREFGIINLAAASLFALYLVLSKNRYVLLKHPTGQIFLSGFFFVYLLGSGALMFGIGWIPPVILPLYFIPGVLFLAFALKTYHLNKE